NVAPASVVAQAALPASQGPTAAPAPESPPATDSAAPQSGSDADAAARSLAADARAKRLARKRLEEIRLEDEAIAQRQKEELIQRLLAGARAAYAVGAFTHPDGDCAADRYREILKLRPNQPDAVA